jgi:hypothetical protein
VIAIGPGFWTGPTTSSTPCSCRSWHSRQRLAEGIRQSHAMISRIRIEPTAIDHAHLCCRLLAKFERVQVDDRKSFIFSKRAGACVQPIGTAGISALIALRNANSPRERGLESKKRSRSGASVIKTGLLQPSSMIPRLMAIVVVWVRSLASSLDKMV